MQISSGTCFVTKGSATVVASAENDWSEALTALLYGTPVYFMLLGKTEVPRSVVAAQSPNTPTASGNWEITLSAPWSGETTVPTGVDLEIGDGYLIHKDFTVNLQLAMPTAGEQGWAQLLARNMQIIDTAIVNQNVALPPPAMDTASGTPGFTTFVQSGKTLYACGGFEIPAGSVLDIAVGGVLEVG